MKQQLSSNFVPRIAILLCLSLFPAVGKAGERQDRPARVQADASLNGKTAQNAQLFDARDITELSERAEEPGTDVVGGALTNQQLTYIVIALAAAVLVLVLK